jgi:hypothetical protein
VLGFAMMATGVGLIALRNQFVALMNLVIHPYRRSPALDAVAWRVIVFGGLVFIAIGVFELTRVFVP